MTRRRLLGEPCRASRQCHTCSLWPLRWLRSDRVCLCAVSSRWVWTLPAVPRGGAPPPHLPSGPSAGLASVACASWWGRPRLVAGGVKNRALRRLQVSPSFGSCCAGPASPPGPAAPRGLWCRSASLSWAPGQLCLCRRPHPDPRVWVTPLCPGPLILVCVSGAGAQVATPCASRDPASRPPFLIRRFSLRPPVSPPVAVSCSREAPARAGWRGLGGAGEQPRLAGFLAGERPEQGLGLRQSVGQ